MRIRRPLAALLTTLALLGGGATLTACGDPAGTDRSDGTSDLGNPDESAGPTLPNNSDPEITSGETHSPD